MATFAQNLDTIPPTKAEGTARVGTASSVTTRSVNPAASDVSLGIQNDGTPLLLLPVRIETRFADRPTGPELWLRIYPDQIAIDSHDPTLTVQECTLAQAYWQAMAPLLPGDTAGQQTAWVGLAAGLGPRRAAYVALTTAPAGFEAWLTGANTQTEAASTPLGTALTIETTPSGALRDASWNQPALARALPTVWYVALSSGSTTQFIEVTRPPEDLAVSPDPVATALPGSPGGPTEAMNWMVDFRASQQAGMAVAIGITAEQRTGGFDSIAVFGYSGVSGTAGSDLFSSLLTAHRFTDGLAFAPQGTPTKNSPDGAAGYTSKDPAYAISFANERCGPLMTEVAVTPEEWVTGQTADGRAFCASLGIDPSIISHCPNAAGSDQTDAVAMATALWPATGDYYLRYLYAAAISSTTREEIREFASQLVRGRGPIPALQVGDIPYGILPICSVTKSGRLGDRTGSMPTYVHTLVQAARGIWEKAVAGFPLQVGSPVAGVTPEQALANVLGRDASTVKVDAHLNFGPWLIWNLGCWDVSAGDTLIQTGASEALIDFPFSPQNFNAGEAEIGVGKTLSDAGVAIENVAIAAKNLSESEAAALGWSAPTAVLDGNVYFAPLGQNLRHVTADGQVSETKGLPTNRHLSKTIHGYNGKIMVLREPVNILAYLVTFYPSALLKFTPSSSDLTLLVALVRQALLLEYAWAASQILGTTLTEPELCDIPAGEQPGTLVWALSQTSYNPPAGLLPADGMLGDYIAKQMGTAAGQQAFPSLAALLNAVTHLAQMPTAGLERALLESLDICGYRLDAWATAVATSLLAGGRETKAEGLGIGVWGYVEKLRPAAAQVLSEKDKAALAIAAEVGPSATDAPVGPAKDTTGFIFGPSLAHAAAGAILRNGYLAHSGGTYGTAYAIDLSSERTRHALYLMEGMRQGQHLGSLLGYQFEQGVNQAGLQMYLQPFRDLYPIVANKIAQQAGTPTDAVAACNVVDGAALQRAWTEQTVPWGSGALATALAGSTDYDKLTALLNGLNDSVDALSDIAVAESVYQVAMGNPVRSGGALNASSREQHAPEPAVVETPRSGLDLTQRVLSTFAVNPTGPLPSAWLSGATLTPRAVAEPWLEQWLGAVLPGPGDVKFQVTYTPSNGSAPVTSPLLTLAAAGLSALDLLALAPPPPAGTAAAALDGSELAGSDMERWILAQCTTAGPLPAGIQQVTVTYARAGLGAVPMTIPELLVLVRSLQELVRASRPLEPDDFISATAQAPAADLDFSGVAQRLQAAFTGLSSLNAGLAGLLAGIPSNSPTPANGDSISTFLMSAAGYGFVGAAPATTTRDSASLAQLLAQATAVSAKIAQRVSEIQEDASLFAAGQLLVASVAPTLQLAQKTAQAIFGPAFVVLPVITPGGADDPVAEATADLAIGIAAWQTSAATDGNLAAASVIQQLTALRPPIRRLDEVMVLSAALTGLPVGELSVTQLGGLQPYSPATPWLGQGPVAAQFPWMVNGSGTPQTLRGTYSLLVWTPPALGAPTGASMCGLYFDHWLEQIPNNVERTAVAFHYPEPAARAPQAMLLAVLPESVETWTANELYQAVLEAVALAKIRTVDPQTLELGGKVGQLLPALFQASGKATISSFIPAMPTSTDGVGS